MSYVAFTFWLVAQALDVYVFPANNEPDAVVGPDTLNNPTLEMFADAVMNEFALEKVAVKRTVFDDDDVAAVTAERTTDAEPFVDTSPESDVSAAAGAPPVPKAMCDT